MPSSQPDGVDITPAEFANFQRLIFELAGISLADAKKVLLVGRLGKRLKHFGFTRFADYYKFVREKENAGELQLMIDLITTNETYFFREPKHFDFLRSCASPSRGTPFRVWSAASSSGEEAYSMAMVLADALGEAPWEVVGTDISTRVLRKAEQGHYSLDRISGIPPAMLKKYCLKGIREQEGTMLIVRELRQRVRFLHSNLLAPRKDIGVFDLIFLRNVMIYFDNPTKRKVVANLLPYLKRDGHLVIGHSESLFGVTDDFVALRPTIYQRAR